jgi:hypothetical protein
VRDVGVFESADTALLFLSRASAAAALPPASNKRGTATGTFGVFTEDAGVITYAVTESWDYAKVGHRGQSFWVSVGA